MCQSNVSQIAPPNCKRWQITHTALKGMRWGWGQRTVIHVSLEEGGSAQPGEGSWPANRRRCQWVKSPSGPHTTVTAAQSRDGPSAESLLQERTSHSTWERCSQVQRLLYSDTWRHLQISSYRAQTLTPDPSTTKKTMIFNLPDLVTHQVLTTNPSSKAGWSTDLTL